MVFSQLFFAAKTFLSQKNYVVLRSTLGTLWIGAFLLHFASYSAAKERGERGGRKEGEGLLLSSSFQNVLTVPSGLW